MKMSIKTKLVSPTAFTALALMAVGATGIYIASNLNKGLSEIVFQKIPVIKDLGSIDMIHEGLKGSVLESNIAHLSDDQARIAKMNKEIEERKKLVTSFFKEVKEKNLSANVRSKVNIASKDFEE